MHVAVFDLGRTLMEYTGMPESWIAFYEQGFQAINSHFSCNQCHQIFYVLLKYYRAGTPGLWRRKKRSHRTGCLKKLSAIWINRLQISKCMETFFRSLHRTIRQLSVRIAFKVLSGTDRAMPLYSVVWAKMICFCASFHKLKGSCPFRLTPTKR